MALTAVSVPTGVHLSRNIIPLKLHTDAYHIGGGGFHSIFFAIENNPSEGDTMQISWSYNGQNYTVILTFTATPNSSGNQVALLTSGTMVNYLNTVISTAITLHPVLCDFWEIWTTSSGTLAIKSKIELLSDVSATGSGDFLFVGTQASFPFLTYPLVAVATEMEAREDLFILVRFYVEDEWNSGVYNFIAEAFYKPQIDEYFEGDIHVDIHHFFEPSVRAHHVGTYDDLLNPIQIIREMNKRCRIEAWEYYSNSKQNKGYRSNSFRVIHGGMDEYEYTQITPFGNGWGGSMRYLTYRPNEREVTANEPHLLHWLCHRVRGLLPGFSPEYYRLRALVWYTDGTNANTVLADDYAVVLHDTVKFVVGFEANNLHNLEPTKTAYKYQIWWRAQIESEFLAPIVTYYLQPNRPHQRFLTWRNSFGYAEVTRFYGESEFIAQVEREFAEIAFPLEVPFLEDAITAIAHKQKLTRAITLESGPMSADEMRAHTDMLKSSIVWLHLLPNTAYTPLMMPFKLIPGTFKMGYKNYEGDFINGIKITLEYMDTTNWSNTYAEWLN